VDKHCSSSANILHIIDTTGPGGAETIFIQIADLIRSRGFNSAVVIRGPGWVRDELIRRGIQPIVLEAKGSFNVQFLWALIRLIRKQKIELIHSHLLGSNVYAALAGLLARVPVVATYHGMVDVNPQERFRKIKHLAMKWGIARYIVVSKSLFADIQKQGLLNPSKTEVIYNGINIERYAKNQDQTIRTQLGLPGNAILVGSLGNIRPAKSYDQLVAAAAEVIAQNDRVHFVIAGHQKAGLMAELGDQIDRLKVGGHIHFLGFHDDSAAMLGQMNNFLLCSSTEGFSISTIEAMATGLPVLVTRCGGPEEIVEHNKTGWMVDVGKPSALAGGLLALIGNGALEERLALAGREHVNKVFSANIMVEAYRGVYCKLLRPNA